MVSLVCLFVLVMVIRILVAFMSAVVSAYLSIILDFQINFVHMHKRGIHVVDFTWGVCWFPPSMWAVPQVQ